MTAVLQRVDREWLGREDEWKARMLLKAAVRKRLQQKRMSVKIITAS